MKRICLITHGEATHSTEGKVGGWFNSELTKEGRKQASELPARLGKLGINIVHMNVYSSDLKRAAQTAELLTAGTGILPILDKRLREMSFGTHEGMDQDEHNEIMIPVSPDGDRLEHRICNGAESRKIVASRISEFMEEIMKSDQDKIIVTHGFTATFIIAVFQKIAISSMGFINYKLAPASISLLEEDKIFKNRTVSLLNG